MQAACYGATVPVANARMYSSRRARRFFRSSSTLEAPFAWPTMYSFSASSHSCSRLSSSTASVWFTGGTELTVGTSLKGTMGA